MENVTYSEARGLSQFDWRVALANPPEQGTDEHHKLRHLAEAWATCAVGNQCALIPRCEVSGQPLDPELTRLGLSFMNEVEDCEWDSAIETLRLIELRSTSLLRSIQ